MKFVKLETDASRERILESLGRTDLLPDKIFAHEKRGKPKILVKDRGNGKITVRCRMIGGATVDNGFLEGTYFRGTLTEREGKTTLKGVIITAPIYHTVLFSLLAFFIVWCVLKGFFNPVPLIYFVFSFIMFKGEFVKQRIIHSAFVRAIRLAEDRGK